MNNPFNRGPQLPSERMYAPFLRDHWLASRVSEDSTRPSIMIGEAITQALGGKNGTIYRFGVPNAGFEVDVRFLGQNGANGSQLVFMLRQDVKSQEEFEKLQRTIDPLTNKPYISPKAEFQDPGKYPVGAAVATKNDRNADEPIRWLNPYDYVDNPERLSFRDSKTGEQKAVVELFGLPKNQNDVAERQVKADVQQDFSNVRGRSGLSNVFGGLFGGSSQQQQQPQPHPGQQQQQPADCPSVAVTAAVGAVGGFLGGLLQGGNAKQTAVQGAVAAADQARRTPKPRGCE